VYNHTGATEKSNFNQLVPGYYYRQNAMGEFSNASACGNETASERPMMRKFMRESVKHWVNEYHIDGFRFDLMGIHDMETMDLIAGDVRAIDPSIFVYGEGWTAGNSPLPDDKKALKRNTYLMDHVAAFSDDIRDGLKGHVFTFDEKGFVSGKEGLEETVKFGIVASTQHPQIDYKAVNYSDAPWAKSPLQTITYVSCHDNHTLWDRLTLSCPDATEEEKKRMHKLALTMVLTSQGISFLHAGVELGRTKYGEENSFESPDSINQFDWTWKTKNNDIFEYTQSLVALRKAHPAFRMTTTEMLKKHIQFLDTEQEKVVSYTISDHANGDDWKNILLIFNGNTSPRTVSIPEGDWALALNAEEINLEGIRKVNGTSVQVEASSALILFQKN
jgi:pullulanase